LQVGQWIDANRMRGDAFNHPGLSHETDCPSGATRRLADDATKSVDRSDSRRMFRGVERPVSRRGQKRAC
jgi:hypothetical protein